MKMKEMGLDERPVEKMLGKGAGALSNSELLAVLLRSGTSGMNVMELSRTLLGGADNSLTRLSAMSVEQLTRLPGLGRTKAAVLQAAFELGRRFQSERCWEGKETIDGADKVFAIMLPLLKGLTHEQLWALFLNRANYLIGKEMLSRGGMSATVIDQKMVIIRAMEKKASSVIIVHNHPSGNPRPGMEDLKQTQRLREALKNVDLTLTDHVIICDDGYYSFAQESQR